MRNFWDYKNDDLFDKNPKQKTGTASERDTKALCVGAGQCWCQYGWFYEEKK